MNNNQKYIYIYIYIVIFFTSAAYQLGYLHECGPKGQYTTSFTYCKLILSPILCSMSDNYARSNAPTDISTLKLIRPI
jgi:hypothetical protein